MDRGTLSRAGARGRAWRPTLVAIVLVACAVPPPGSSEQSEPSPPVASPADASPADASSAPPSEPVEVRRLDLEIVARYPHDRRGFTQGLLWHGGHLYESTGRYGQSEIRRLDLESGRVLARRRLDDSLFGEGLARVGDRLVQLTWQAGVANVYELESLALIDAWSYDGQGWGLAYDPEGARLIRSDGSARLTFHDPMTFAELGNVEVTLDGRPLANLNELEVVDGAVWANVWQRQELVRIDPENGAVTAIVDARGLLGPVERRGTDVLNGIAYDPESGLFYLTGKLWPALFAVRFVDAEARTEPPPPTSRR